MPDMKGKRILLYVRVSTEEQARYGESIADQRQALSEWAKKHGCVVVHEFVDEGFSARKPYKSRPALCALLNAVENREADAVVFTKLDRWLLDRSSTIQVNQTKFSKRPGALLPLVFLCILSISFRTALSARQIISTFICIVNVNRSA